VRFRRIFSGFISLTAIPSCGRACAGARYRAAAIRPCLGCASGMFSLTAIPAFGRPREAGIAVSEINPAILNRLAALHRLPRYVRLAIEARPLGRARAGPRRSRGTAVSEINQRY